MALYFQSGPWFPEGNGTDIPYLDPNRMQSIGFGCLMDTDAQVNLRSAGKHAALEKSIVGRYGSEQQEDTSTDA